MLGVGVTVQSGANNAANNMPRPAFQMQFCESTSRWKFPKLWRWFVTVVIWAFLLSSGLNFNVLPGAIYCAEQMENDTRYADREDLPHYLGDPQIRSSLFGAYNWFTPLAIVPTLLLCEYGGGEIVFLVARIIQGALEFAAPAAFPGSYIGVDAIRAIQGSCCGIIYALMGPISQKHSFLTNIALVITFSISFFRMGIALPIIISGQFCKVGDWSSDFYIFGSFTLAICVLWFIIVFFDFKKRKEIKHLEKKVKAPPLFNVLSEAALTVFREYSTYCLMVPAFITHFCQFAVFTMGPKFYKDVYHFQLSKNRWYAIVPMLTPCIGAPISGLLVQMISKKLSFSVSMKIVHTFGNLIPCITFFLIAFVPDLEVLHAMIILAVTFLFVPYFSATVIRGAVAIKPKFSRLVSGLVTSACFAGFATSPYVVEAVTASKTKESWTTMWAICGGLFFLSWLIYLPIRFEEQSPSQQKVIPISTQRNSIKNGAI